MSDNPFCAALQHVKECFDRTTACLDEDDAGFVPVDCMWTVARQVAHVAQTVDWFVAGAFDPKGFDLDFARHAAEIDEVTSLAEARAWLDRAFANAIDVLRAKTPEDMNTPIAAGPIMGGAPRSAIVPGITDHTAHHRGALSVYARLRTKTPAMPYA